MNFSKEDVSHYNYLEKHLNNFWLKVFNKTLEESFSSGIISAHGDKSYGYKRRWEQAGIPFPHGVALYFLTYKKEIVQTREDISAVDWVVDNYEKYKEYLVPIDLSDPEIMSFSARKREEKN